MTLQALLQELEAREVRIEARGGKLYLSPKARLTPDLLDAVRAHKPDLLALAATTRAVQAAFPNARLIEVVQPIPFNSPHWRVQRVG
jgi:hypothetical protein